MADFPGLKWKQELGEPREINTLNDAEVTVEALRVLGLVVDTAQATESISYAYSALRTIDAAGYRLRLNGRPHMVVPEEELSTFHLLSKLAELQGEPKGVHMRLMLDLICMEQAEGLALAPPAGTYQKYGAGFALFDETYSRSSFAHFNGAPYGRTGGDESVMTQADGLQARSNEIQQAYPQLVARGLGVRDIALMEIEQVIANRPSILGGHVVRFADVGIDAMREATQVAGFLFDEGRTQLHQDFGTTYPDAAIGITVQFGSDI